MKHTFVFHAHLTIFSYFEFRQRTSPGPLWLFCLCHWSFAGAMILTIFFFIFNEWYFLASFHVTFLNVSLLLNRNEETNTEL